MGERVAPGGTSVYTVEVQGEQFVVKVSEGGQVQSTTPVEPGATTTGAVYITAPLAGNVFRLNVRQGDAICQGDVVLILEAMKMETEIRTASDGRIGQVLVEEGDAVHAGDNLILLA